ncbi:MAG: hypothetical protein JW807_14280 [Spirochaetes bacterium]|nr:hypothetical protein [Spirochaetota bacterium]
MIPFRGFTLPLWEIFGGNLLLLICSLFYLAWWGVSFRPNSPGGPAGPFLILAAFITGCAGIGLMAAGISQLAGDSKALPVRFIVAGGFALFILLLLVTYIGFHRIVTSELLIIHLWAALELSAVAVLYGTGRFGAGRAAALAALVGIVTVIGLISYVLYYRLDDVARYRIGMVPLGVDAAVIAVFLVLLSTA